MKALVVLLFLLLPSSAYALDQIGRVSVSNGVVAKARYAVFGDGSDSAFSFPTPGTGGSCSNGTDCPSAFCTTCTDRSGGVRDNGCICTLTANSTFGLTNTSTAVSGTDVSTELSLTTFDMGDKNVLTIDWAATNGCGYQRGGNLIIRTTGNFTMGDGGATNNTNNAYINLQGKGGCGGAAASNFTNNGGNDGCSAGTLGGTGTEADDGKEDGNPASSVDSLSWFLGQNFPVLSGAGSNTALAGTACNSILSNVNAMQPGGGGAGENASCGGNGDDCDASTPGAGGGGLIIAVGGEMKLDAYAELDTSGVDATGDTLGGSGGGSQLLIYMTKDFAGTSVTDATAGLASSACSGGGKCGAGGAGGDGDVLEVDLD